MNSITSALTWIAVAAICLFALPVLAVIRLFDRTPTQLYAGRAFRVMGSWTTRINPAWNVEIGGVDPKTLEHPFVVVSNHQSVADIPTVSLLPWEMKWVGKKELFDLPVMGWMMKLAGDIAVDRKDPNSRASVMLRTRQKLQHGTSVMFFAEGTRSRDGRVKRFYDGAFRLAIEAGVPVLPLAIDGTMDAIPKHGWRYNRADVRLDVLEPVPTTGLTLEDVAALRDRVRQRIVEHIAAWREVPAELADALIDATPALEAGAGVSEMAVPTGEERAKSGVAVPRAGSGG
ncbi:lysophospholipid acyltransferase family protein [Rubrivirga sp.]|uniref:lysophospholipid acyltransferase family protein n=1 Tax=Rubrivirga sp. TaxID=1885344 RepID=UPI003C752C82